MPDNERGRLTVESTTAMKVTDWLAAVAEFQASIRQQHGVFPDSAAEIHAERRPHD